MPTRWTKAGDSLGEAFTERLGYKAAALFFAVALWVVASGDETAEQYVPVRFTPTVEPGLRLEGDAPRLRALVTGPTRQLLKLYRDPPTVHHSFGPSTPTSLTLELRASDVDLPAGTDDVAVRAVEPRVVSLRFGPAAPATVGSAAP